MNMSSLVPLAPRIFDLFDNNRDGTVDMREILCGFSSLRNSRGDDALRLCFQVHFFFPFQVDLLPAKSSATETCAIYLSTFSAYVENHEQNSVENQSPKSSSWR